MRNFGVHFLLCLLISWPGVSLSGGPEERKVRWPRSDSDRYLFKVLGRLMQKDNDLTRRMEVADMIQTMPGKSKTSALRRIPIFFSLPMSFLLDAGNITHTEVHLLTSHRTAPPRIPAAQFQVQLSLWSEGRLTAQRRFKRLGRRAKNGAYFAVDIGGTLSDFCSAARLQRNDRVRVRISEPRRFFRQRRKRKVTEREGVMILFSKGMKPFSLEQEIWSEGGRTRRSLLKKAFGRFTDRVSKPHQPHSALCQPHHFTIDFDQLAWFPQIVAPRRLSFNFCFGGCGGIPHALEVPNNHASVLGSFNLMQGVLPPANRHGPKCAPIEFEPLDILEVKRGRALLRRVPDVFVTKCGCR